MVARPRPAFLNSTQIPVVQLVPDEKSKPADGHRRLPRCAGHTLFIDARKPRSLSMGASGAA